MDAPQMKGKYGEDKYKRPDFVKTYHPKKFTDDYKQNVFTAHKPVQVSQLEELKEAKLNRLSFMELLGCTGK